MKNQNKTSNKLKDFNEYWKSDKEAQVCPVCNGSGKISRGGWASSTADLYITCHGCLGCGWVTVQVISYFIGKMKE